jgi:hypothetical protein
MHVPRSLDTYRIKKIKTPISHIMYVNFTNKGIHMCMYSKNRNVIPK